LAVPRSIDRSLEKIPRKRSNIEETTSGRGKMDTLAMLRSVGQATNDLNFNFVKSINLRDDS